MKKKRRTAFVRRKGKWVEIDYAIFRFNRRRRRERKEALKRSRMPQDQRKPGL